MTEEQAGKSNVVDRTGWPKGPWDDEPDRVDFKTETGFPAIALRHQSGHWCGYVAVPPGHPAYDSGDDGVVNVHGGVTYAARCHGNVCHVPVPGEPDDVFWLGFDFAHCHDANPSRWEIESGWTRWSEDGKTAYLGSASKSVMMSEVRGVYRDLVYVRAECESVGRQLAAMAKSRP